MLPTTPPITFRSEFNDDRITRVSFDNLPDGTSAGLRQIFSHRDFKRFFAIEIDAPPKGHYSYVFDNQFGPAVQKCKTADLLALDNLKDRREPHSKLIVPLAIEDIQRLHRMISTAVANTGLVIHSETGKKTVEAVEAAMNSHAQQMRVLLPVTPLTTWLNRPLADMTA